MVLDGMPSSGLVQATLIELIIGRLCAAPLVIALSKVSGPAFPMVGGAEAIQIISV